MNTLTKLSRKSRAVQVGYLDLAGDFTENKHLDPDHEVDNDPALEAAGRDQQLERAVEVLLDRLRR